jgi:hypothetical protein
MEKTFRQKNFNNFVCTPLGSRFNININICLQVHFKVSAACIVAIVDTGGKFATGVVDTGGNFAATVVDTSGAP